MLPIHDPLGELLKSTGYNPPQPSRLLDLHAVIGRQWQMLKNKLFVHQLSRVQLGAKSNSDV